MSEVAAEQETIVQQLVAIAEKLADDYAPGSQKAVNVSGAKDNMSQWLDIFDAAFEHLKESVLTSD